MDQSKFIAECAAKSISSPEAIAEKAKQRIAEIDIEIHRVDLLRQERAELMNITKMFSSEPPRSSKRSVPVISEEMTAEQLDQQSLGICIKVCKQIEEQKKCTPRNIFDKYDVVPSGTSEYYAVFKWLLARGIIARTDDRSFIKGENFEKRPSMDF